MNKLIIEDDEGRTTIVPLVRDEITIGRKEGNTIRLTERNVSRKHARLLKQNGSVYVEDLASYTGVRVNGIRISALTALKDGDQVQIGDYRLAVRAEATALAPDAGPDAEPADAEPAPVPVTAPAIPVTMIGAAAVSTAAAAAIVAAEPPTLPEGTRVPAAVVAATAEATAAAQAAPAAAASAPAAPAKDAPAVRARIEAAPTMPLKMLGAEDRPTPPPPLAGPPARLVIVTTELAGMEFRLDRPSLVVGRTDENDIILNHASISRHHAKILREGERYIAVDLQSANGVRVSGQEHDRVDLQAGDVIELGHVKARFVGPWESWIYDPREFAPPSRRGLKIGAAVAGVLVAGTAVLLFQETRKSDATEASAVVAAGTAAPPSAPAGPAPAQLLADATAAAADESWDKAVTPLDLLLATQTGDAAAAALKPRAAELKRKVDLERRSAEIFADFRKAVSDEEPDDALARYEEIPADSIYKPRATSAVPDVKKLFVATHLALAEKARTDGRCDDSRGEVDKLLKVDPTHKRAREIARTCHPHPEPRLAAAAPAAPRAPAAGGAGPPAAAGRPSPPVRAAAAPRGGASRGVPATTAPVGEPAGGGEAAASDSDPADLIKQAREAWLHQQCGAAIDLSRRALKLKPSASEAHQIIAVCACTLKDRDGATRAYHKLDERGRGMVRSLCARNGVELGE